jgi:uncharacterized protein
MSLTSIVRRHPTLSFFLLAYAITWTGIFAVVGIDGLQTGDLDMSRGMIVWLLMLLGPGVSGVFLTWLIEGRPGLTAMRRRMTRLPDRFSQYVLLLIAPAAAILTVSIFWFVSPDFEPMAISEPSKIFIVLMFFVLSFGAFIEELGWTGFATRTLRMLYSVAGTALLLGVLHGAWHFLADFSGRGDASAVYYYPRFIVLWIAALIVLRVLIVSAYDKTESLLLAQLLHAFYTAPLFILTPTNANDAQSLAFWAVFTGLFLVFTIIVLVWSGNIRLRELSRDLAANQIDPAPAPVAQTRQKRAR